jgi:glycerophosphoryl diester phosphodiesterase
LTVTTPSRHRDRTTTDAGTARGERDPLLIAHRGGSGLAPENTLVAFRNAVEQWASGMIELDVHASRDGHCVVMHDATVDRTTDGTGRIAS